MFLVEYTHKDFVNLDLIGEFCIYSDAIRFEIGKRVYLVNKQRNAEAYKIIYQYIWKNTIK